MEVYGPVSFTSEASLGAAYTYVVRIPKEEFAAEGNPVVTLRGPVTGQAKFSQVWVGPHDPAGGPCDFDGTQRQATFNGSHSITLANQDATSDVLDTQVRADRDLLIAYVLQSGDSYARKFDLPTGFALFYRQGTTGAGGNVKTGFSMVEGMTASVRAITAGIYAPPPPIVPQENTLLAMSLAGVLCTASKRIEGVAGKHLHFQLHNGPDTNRRALLLRLAITADQDTDLLINSHSQLISLTDGGTMPKCNPHFGAGQSVMSARWRQDTSILGNPHDSQPIKAGVRFPFDPYIVLPPDLASGGGGLVLTFAKDGVGAHCTMEWAQLPLA